MPAQIARTGVLSERSKRKKKRAVGDLGQDPGEMATAGAQPALVRLGPDGCCGGQWWQELPVGVFPWLGGGNRKFSGGEWVGGQSWRCWLFLVGGWGTSQWAAED